MGVARKSEMQSWAGGSRAYVVRSSEGRVVVVLSGADAADAALDWVARGYEVDEADAATFGLGPQLSIPA